METGNSVPGGGLRPRQPAALLRPRLPGEPVAPVQPGQPAAPAQPGQPAVPGQPGPERAVAEPLAAEVALADPAAGARERLPLLPGFREMASRRAAGTAQPLIAQLAARRQSAGLSQTEVAARMGTSQSAVARLEAGGVDARVSTLERYAAAVGSQLRWRLQEQSTDPEPEERR